MDGAVVRELLRELVPPAATAHPEDDRVERRARVDALPAGALRRVQCGQDALDHTPEVIGHLPDGREGLGSLS
jgi:hypothetical protein